MERNWLRQLGERKSIVNGIRKILEVIFHFLRKELTDEIFQSVMQFIKFGLVGLSNTVISYVIYLISLVAFRHFNIFEHADYVISQIMAFILSVLWSFFLNSKYVFSVEVGENRSLVKSLLKTYLSYAFTGLFLNSILLVLWVNLLNISEYLAPMINLIISVPLNFIINKFWAFKSE